MKAITTLVNKAKSAPIKTKAIIGTGILFALLVVALIVSIRSCNDAETAVDIEKLKPQIEATKNEVSQKTADLKNSVLDHDKSIQDKVSQITKKAQIKPFKPMNYESTKVKDASYDAMRLHLDTVQPNK
jgi:cell division protein FtsL